MSDPGQRPEALQAGLRYPELLLEAMLPREGWSCAESPVLGLFCWGWVGRRFGGWVVFVVSEGTHTPEVLGGRALKGFKRFLTPNEMFKGCIFIRALVML